MNLEMSYLPKWMDMGPANRAPVRPPNEKIDTMSVQISVTWYTSNCIPQRIWNVSLTKFWIYCRDTEYNSNERYSKWEQAGTFSDSELMTLNAVMYT